MEEEKFTHGNTEVTLKQYIDDFIVSISGASAVDFVFYDERGAKEFFSSIRNVKNINF